MVSWSGRPCELLEASSPPSEQSALFGDAEKAVVLDDSGPWERGELAVTLTCPLKNATNTSVGESVCCGSTGCTGSCLTSVVGRGFAARLEPDTCEICGKTKWISRNVLPREQSEPCLFSSGYGEGPLRNVTNTHESSGELRGTITVTRTAQRMSSAHPVPIVPSGAKPQRLF